MTLSSAKKDQLVLPKVSFDEEFDDDEENIIAIRTISDRKGVLVSEGEDGAEKVGMLDINGRLELRNTLSYKKEQDLVEILFVSHKVDKWSAAVGFGAPADDWRITKLKEGGQFARKGVQRGWRIHSINGQVCNRETKTEMKKQLIAAERCTITFEIGTVEDIRKWQEAFE